jgi:hypothetical protein
MPAADISYAAGAAEGQGVKRTISYLTEKAYGTI